MVSYSNVRGAKGIRQLVALSRYKVRNRNKLALVKYRGFLAIRDKLESLFESPLAGKTLLEVGCGQWKSNVKLFSGMGVKIVGIDPEAPPESLLGYPRFFWECGVQRAVKTLANEVIFRRQFDSHLEELSQLKSQRARQRVLRVGGERVPFEDASFDAVFSDNVFEHLSDVDAVTREIHRVLRPGGFLYLIIHPFTAFSGGHHPATYHHDPDIPFRCEIPPWDHLRDNRFPSGVYCNGLRASEYKTIFDRYLAAIEWSFIGPEHEELLSPEILRELPGYNREELLTGKLHYVGQRS